MLRWYLVIAMQAELSFCIVCKNYTKVMLPNPVLSLEMGCITSNEYMNLMHFYHTEGPMSFWIYIPNYSS